jgi:ABC-type dipeptide/oligopeptide/nickel transport system permease subunit
LGFGFSPFVVRLVRDKIRTLKSEEFVSAAKAHGIPQRDIIWRHIIRKNALTNIVILAAQIWGFAMLMEISLSYVFSIGSAKLGGEPYHSWAWMLLTQESKNALIGNVENLFVNWWLWFFPAFFTGATIVGFYLFGDALKQWHSRREQFGIPVVRSSFEEELQRQLAVRGKSKLQALLKGI